MDIINFIEEHWKIISTIFGVLSMGIGFWVKEILLKPISRNKANLEKQNQNYNLKFDETHKKMDSLKSDISSIAENTAKNQGMLETLVEFNKP